MGPRKIRGQRRNRSGVQDTLAGEIEGLGRGPEGFPVNVPGQKNRSGALEFDIQEGFQPIEAPLDRDVYPPVLETKTEVGESKRGPGSLRIFDSENLLSVIAGVPAGKVHGFDRIAPGVLIEMGHPRRAALNQLPIPEVPGDHRGEKSCRHKLHRRACHGAESGSRNPPPLHNPYRRGGRCVCIPAVVVGSNGITPHPGEDVGLVRRSPRDDRRPIAEVPTDAGSFEVDGPEVHRFTWSRKRGGVDDALRRRIHGDLKAFDPVQVAGGNEKGPRPEKGVNNLRRTALRRRPIVEIPGDGQGFGGLKGEGYRLTCHRPWR